MYECEIRVCESEIYIKNMKSVYVRKKEIYGITNEKELLL